jgi:hypothetical protein
MLTYQTLQRLLKRVWSDILVKIWIWIWISDLRLTTRDAVNGSEMQTGSSAGDKMVISDKSAV